MLIYETDKVTPKLLQQMSMEESDWIYNGLDCCVTLECLNEMLPNLDNQTGRTYSFSLDLQAPILQMNMRGILTDQERRDEVVAEYRAEVNSLRDSLYEIVREGVGYNLENWRSNDQIKELLYDVMQLQPVRKRNSNGILVPTVERDALEELWKYFLPRPIIGHLLALRDIDKKISVLETSIDSDGRIRSNFNIAGTTTGRLSSSLGDFGTGGNLQNIEKRLRSVLVADRGYKFANIDLAQADARNVGAICYELFGANTYLDTTESGDLHTNVCRMAWKDLAWGDDPDKWRSVADGKGYRHLSYRDLTKKLGHGTNYYGQPKTMAKHSKVDVVIIKEFQSRYFASFPEIPLWHEWTRETLKKSGQITTLFGRKRDFWGRRNDEETLRAAIAHQGQSMTAEEVNNAMLNCWRLNAATIMLQVHDSLVFQYPEEREDEVIRTLRPAMRSPLTLRNGREFCVPHDVQVGWNLGEFNDKTGENPDGLTSYKGHDDRKRQRVI